VEFGELRSLCHKQDPRYYLHQIMKIAKDMPSEYKENPLGILKGKALESYVSFLNHKEKTESLMLMLTLVAFHPKEHSSLIIGNDYFSFSEYEHHDAPNFVRYEKPMIRLYLDCGRNLVKMAATFEEPFNIFTEEEIKNKQPQSVDSLIDFGQVVSISIDNSRTDQS